MTTVLSESLVQVIVGFGFPSAEQFKVSSAGAVTFTSLEMIMLLAGSTKSRSALNKGHAIVITFLQAALEK